MSMIFLVAGFWLGASLAWAASRQSFAEKEDEKDAQLRASLESLVSIGRRAGYREGLRAGKNESCADAWNAGYESARAEHVTNQHTTRAANGRFAKKDPS